MKKFIGFFILLIIMMCSCSFASVDVPEYIRVGLFGLIPQKEYSDFIEEQVQKEIAIQKQVADIVINC